MRSVANPALSITGFAGPGGKKDEEGLVHFAAGHANGKPCNGKEHFDAIGPDPVRLAALEIVLAMIKELLEE